MNVVCGGAASNDEAAFTDNNATSSNSSCAGVRMTSCDSGTDVAGKYVITNSCALFDFAAYTVVMGSLSALGLVGNVVSFVVLLRDRGRSATSFLLQALAVADTMVLVAAVPLYIVPPIYPYTGRLAAFYSAYLSILPVLWPIYFIPYTFTVLVTVLVSMHRYCAVCKPNVARCARIVASSSTAAGGGLGRSRHGGGSASIRFSPSTSHQARCRVAGLAAFSVIYNIPRFFEYESVPVCSGAGNETHYAFKLSSFGDDRLYRILYSNVLYFIVIHGGPLLLIGFFNVKLIMALKKRQRRWAEMGKGWYQQDVSLVLVVVMCVFIVCQTPTFVDHILWTFVDETERTCGHWHYYYTAIGDVLVIFNSSVNFVIYILTSRNFRHGLVMQTLSAWANGVGRSAGGGNSAGSAVTPGPSHGAAITVAATGHGRQKTELVTRGGIACGGTYTSGSSGAVALALRVSPAAGGSVSRDVIGRGGSILSKDAMGARRTCSIELLGMGTETAMASSTPSPINVVTTVLSPASAINGRTQLITHHHPPHYICPSHTQPSPCSSAPTKTVRYFEPRVLCR